MKLPRFRLRTLLVLIGLLSIPMGWAAYQLNWIRQRHECVDRFQLDGTLYGIWQFNQSECPWQLRLFGERKIKLHQRTQGICG